jgi:hypothetical protein
MQSGMAFERDIEIVVKPGDQRAPLSVQDVEQVVITPRSQARHTATHWFMSLGLYGL